MFPCFHISGEALAQLINELPNHEGVCRTAPGYTGSVKYKVQENIVHNLSVQSWKVELGGRINLMKNSEKIYPFPSSIAAWLEDI